ncbi:uncharacterized protein [Primulina huaijiensis]|uniref:uncharacterized protein n=1 Tax=Primulina huaijiensis TaxID=1492673 RepID=UPI003CC6E35D
MSARLLKKVLNEQAPPHHHLNSDEANDSDDSDAAPIRRPNPFNLLQDDDSTASDQEKGNIVDETSNCDIGEHTSTLKAADSKPSTKSKKQKKKKKKKNKEISIENDELSSNQLLENLTLETNSFSSSRQQISSRMKKPKLLKANTGGTVKKQFNSSILLVDPKFLKAENELRRIFGSKVVNSYERSHSSVNSRQIHGGRRGSHNLRRTILISPSEHWPRWDGSLSMELLETRDGVHYFRYMHSSSYSQSQKAFEAAKAMHDLNGIASILMYHPYHIDSLMTLADYFKFTGEHQMSADAIAKCLYAMECAWHPLFTSLQNGQLKYVHETNKPFFSLLFNHMKNMDRRGCHRSALEICKLLLSLDLDDPVGSMFCIDYYSLRAEEYAWLEHFSEEYTGDNSLWLFPNFSFSLAVARFYLEQTESSNDGQVDARRAGSLDLMKQALMLHPSVLKKLVAKVPLKDRMWTSVVEHSFFRSEELGNPSLDHLITIYIEKSYLIWRLPDLQKLLLDSARLVIETLKDQGSIARDWACVREEAFSSENNEYSHLLISDFSDATPTMPPDNLQDFIVDQRAVGNDQQLPNIHEDRVFRDVADRNALAVLFESFLPWVNYGTEDGEVLHPDQPDQD